ncbi:hypothetical protein MZO42_05070 [Sphingomonas psychrotolerans]|uniref:Uncharacterized protein n=1 Tax=Sphingomonas psychrotolerans TaxID=1327635 RepID=A0ABU3N1D3_9SPHN|nr:hypothetical protein [Sphingomonas psychrotolerans]MDT8758061.1 hypothetical protein [Sphingomonas psychrotolerans]
MIGLLVALSLCGDRPLDTKPLDKQTPCELGMLGAFQHGAWDGICWRDGNLSGFDHELCRAWWHRDQPIEVEIERTVESASIIITHNVVGGGRSCSDLAHVSLRTLRDRQRSMLVLQSLKRSISKVAARCNLPSPAAALKLTEIKAVLKDTDDLQKLDF